MWSLKVLMVTELALRLNMPLKTVPKLPLPILESNSKSLLASSHLSACCGRKLNWTSQNKQGSRDNHVNDCMEWYLNFPEETLALLNEIVMHTSNRH